MKSTASKGKKKKKYLRTDFTDQDKILGHYMNDVSRYKPLTPEEERKVAKRIRRGDKKATSELVRANLRFVINVAHNYSNQGIPLLDLINIGNMGLIRAAKGFDERKNFKFISYAVWWIRQAMLEALAMQSRAVRVPLTRVTQLMNLQKAKEKIEREMQRTASPAEIEAALKIKHPEALNDIMAMEKPALSLDTPMESGVSLVELLEDDTASSEEEVIKKSEKEEINKHLKRLSSMERKVVQEYYGIGQDHEKTLTEIGNKYKLTRERIRQIKDIAIKKLRRQYHVRKVK
jgi:RNA polymerase primary sigma factor